MSTIMDTEWMREARRNGVGPPGRVAIDRFERSFHDTRKIATTIDMEVIPKEDVDAEVRPCHDCFPILSTFANTQEKLEIKRI